MVRQQARVEQVMMGGDPCQRIRREATTTVVVPRKIQNHCRVNHTFSFNWNTAYLVAHLNLVLLPSTYRHPTSAISCTQRAAAVRAGCIAFSALCALSLHRGFVLELLTFLKRSLRELFHSGAVGSVTGQVLLLCEASSTHARVFIRGVSRRHG